MRDLILQLSKSSIYSTKPSIYGMYVITGLQETHQEFDRYGKAKKIEFTLSLQRVDEDIRERLQSINASELITVLNAPA